MIFQINSVSELETLSHQVRWQYFEKLAAFIFEQSGFDAKQNVVVKSGGTKRQFDVVAKDVGKTFLVECKKWESRKEKTSALRSAVNKHLERCSFYSSINRNENIIPILVTLMDEDTAMHEGVPIVPIMKLNAFLQEFDQFKKIGCYK